MMIITSQRIRNSFLIWTFILQLVESFDYKSYPDGNMVVYERGFHERENMTWVDVALQPKANSIQQNIGDYRQKEVWDVINNMDSYKSNRIYTKTNTNDRPTASSFHYLIVPSWWSNQNTNDPSLLMDKEKLSGVMDKVVEYYSDMSWGKMKITYEFLPQTSIQATKRLNDAKSSVEIYVKEQGYEKEVDYDGIIFVFWESQSTLDSDASGEVNGQFIWSKYRAATYKILRHEVGHNFGHDHHSRNHYVYRETRPKLTSPYKRDGFDMMSGGNLFDISDFHISSKWFFNWAKDSSIVHMQAEGKTTECPACLTSGTFDIKPFDKRDTPSENEILGIHIPIASMYNSRSNSTYVFSYWLSYRSGVENKANGLSIHLTTFKLYGSKMGAYYDSLYYYALGFNEDRETSVVKNGNCYHIAPSSYLKDRVLAAAEVVQPVVCVKNFNAGVDIRVSVSFDPFVEEEKTVNVVEHYIQCGSSMSKSLDSGVHNLIKVSRTGKNGKTTFKMCNPSVTSKAFFFDTYPKSPLRYGSNDAYGSMQLLQSDQGCSTSKMSSLQYSSDFDNTYILVPPTSTSPGSTTSVELSCWVSTCAANQYKSFDKCVKCPDLTPRSNEGTNSVDKCFRCDPGLSLPHPLSTTCAISDKILSISSSKGWRVWAPDFHAVNPDRWELSKIEFYSDFTCSGSVIEPVGEAIDSGNYGSGPEGAFLAADVWDGKKDNTGVFWVGMKFDENKLVQCVKVISTENSVKEIRVQALRADGWYNTWIQKELDTTSSVELILSLEHSPTTAPTPQPVSTSTNTKAPSQGGCSEDTRDVFLWFVVDNTAKVKSCKWLQRQRVGLVRRLCKLDREFGSYEPASRVCLVTCNTCEGAILTTSPTRSPIQGTTSPPVPDPTNSPTSFPAISPLKSPTRNPTIVNPTGSVPMPTQKPISTCVEHPYGRFKRGTSVKNCKWLSKKQNPNTIKNICNETTASETCPVTCGSCSSGSTTDAPTVAPQSVSNNCQDNDSKKFFFKFGQTGNSITRSCVWLRSKAPSVRSFHCEREAVNYIPTASEICMKTCDSC